jgi:hypothetical protein
MSILNATTLPGGKLAVEVNHDPTSTATDCPKGSLVIYGAIWYRKLDDGSTTNVRRMGELHKDHLDGARCRWDTAAKVKIGDSGEISEVRDSTDSMDIIWTGQLTANITVSGKNGLDTGSEAANTWYGVYVIGDSSGVNSPAVLLSASMSSPTLPSGYDKFRLVWVVRNDGSSDIIDFKQTGLGSRRECWYDEPSSNLRPLNNGSATTWTDVDCSACIPPQCELGYFQLSFETGSGGSSGDEADIKAKGFGSSSVTVQAGVKSPQKMYTRDQIPTNSSQKLEYKVTQSANQLTITLRGWYLDL